MADPESVVIVTGAGPSQARHSAAVAAPWTMSAHAGPSSSVVAVAASWSVVGSFGYSRRLHSVVDSTCLE